MATIREVIEQYVAALGTGEQGKLLYERVKKILAIGASEELTINCFKEEIGYISLALYEHRQKQQPR